MSYELVFRRKSSF